MTKQNKKYLQKYINTKVDLNQSDDEENYLINTSNLISENSADDEENLR
jgi:hypothetical protein